MVAIILETDREQLPPAGRHTTNFLRRLPSSPALDVDGRIRSPRIIDVLSRLVSERGAPSFLRTETVRSCVESAAVLDRRAGHRHRIDRAGHALAEWRHGEFQRKIPR